MDKFIKQILKEYAKVILPGFGAISIEDEENGELMFNPYLTYDDGKLAELLEQESNLDMQEAINEVSRFVRDLQHRLNKGETYEIYQLGRFRKNADGEYIFEGNIKTGDIPPLPQTELEDTKKVKEFQKKVEKEKSEETSSKRIKEELKSEEKKEKTIVPTVKPILKAEKETSLKADKTAQKEETVKKKESKTKEKEKIEVKSSTTTPPIPPVVEKEEKKKRSPVFWILIILLFLILAGAAFVGLNYEKVEEYMGWNKFDVIEQNDNSNEIEKEEEAEEAISDEEEQEDEISDEEEDFENEDMEDNGEEETATTDEENITENPIDNTGKNYHIITGSFGEKPNADRQVQKLKDEGFDAYILGQTNGLYTVAAQSYSSMSEAQQDINKIQAIVSGAWISHKN